MKYDSILYVPVQKPDQVFKIYYKIMENMKIEILSRPPFPLEPEKPNILLMIKSKESPDVGR